MTKDLKKPEGIAHCTHYAFMPNQLHFCGPENQADILEFYENINEKRVNRSIQSLLQKFETMYPYLQLIAVANGIKNPFDTKIVEAYWLGNEYLENVPVRYFFNHLLNALKIKKRLGFKKFQKFARDFAVGSLPHHNFHVMNIFQRTGRIPDAHTLSTMDACRISWGEVKKIDKHFLVVKTRPLQIDNAGNIYEGDFIEKSILNQIDRVPLIKEIKEGDFVSFHWGAVCEKIDELQLANLKKYTSLSILAVNNQHNI